MLYGHLLEPAQSQTQINIEFESLLRPEIGKATGKYCQETGKNIRIRKYICKNKVNKKLKYQRNEE